MFLQRRLFKRRRDGQILAPDFIRLHYPCYWHYDILFALKVMAEAGFIRDERCADALDLLESKRLPDGGFPAEFRYYRVAETHVSCGSPVGWGVTSARQMNEFVTAEALGVLKAAGRWSIASGCELRSRECGLPCAAVSDRIRLGDRIGLATRGLRHRCDSMSWLNSWSNTASA